MMDQHQEDMEQDKEITLEIINAIQKNSLKLEELES